MTAAVETVVAFAEVSLQRSARVRGSKSCQPVGLGLFFEQTVIDSVDYDSLRIGFATCSKRSIRT